MWKWVNVNYNPKRRAPDVFLEKGILKVCTKGGHPCRSVISINMDALL